MSSGGDEFLRWSGACVLAATMSRKSVLWRATVDEDEHNCSAVAL
jgi:hypothetical protein